MGFRGLGVWGFGGSGFRFWGFGGFGVWGFGGLGVWGLGGALWFEVLLHSSCVCHRGSQLPEGFLETSSGCRAQRSGRKGLGSQGLGFN